MAAFDRVKSGIPGLDQALDNIRLGDNVVLRFSNAVCEITASEIGFNTELSYGSHIFQDLVEAQILYMAEFPGDKTLHYRPDLIRSFPNRIGEIPGGEKRQDIVYLADVSGQCRLYHDLSAGHILLHL